MARGRWGDMLIHAVAHALRGQKPLADPEAAWWLWWRLRLAFPSALAACLMPDHLHLIAAAATAACAQMRLAHVLSGFTVRASSRGFEPVPLPEVVTSGKHLERQLRYVHLNACRAKLARDPLAWPWSTHRGAIGAELDPWVTDEALAKVLGRPVRGLPSWLHSYVSGDPSVDVGGSPSPVACTPREVSTVPLDTVRRAALAATPWSAPTVRRQQVVLLALHQGWRDTEAIAHAAGLSARTVRRIADEAPDPAALSAARLCLGDPRLLLPDPLLRPVTPVPRAW
ncbi:MAG: hypothetical protein IT377_30065 [Polyangiaceae bacterium]|nr:hypothetical protein [Polyangiaceae bacterium]